MDRQPLKILIVGAGIAGLTAAIGLRREGHEVVIFERSQLAQETAAAIHLAPNCHVILRNFGVFPETFGANPIQGIQEYDGQGNRTVDVDLSRALSIWEQPWMLTHRARLHEELKRLAVQQDAPGIPAVIKTSSKVADVDCSNASVKLLDGSTYAGDLVLGADGVSSMVRTAVAGPEIKPFGSGKSAFRFLIPCSKIAGNPQTEHFLNRNGYMSMWHGADRSIVMYPCENNTVMNCAAIHPSEVSSAVNTGGWSSTANKQLLLDTYRNFGESVNSLLSLVDDADLKVWTLLDMAQLSTWVNERTALLGDAAHPFLPFQGQGGGIAIEDAASISALLPRGTTPDDVPQRLNLYETLRRDRAHTIQEFTRSAGRNLDATDRKKFDVLKFMNYNFNHNEYSHSKHALNKLLWSQNSNARWSSPISFGPVLRPNDVHDAGPKHGSTSTEYTIRFKSSATYLKTLFPTDAYSFVTPGTIAQASFKYRETVRADRYGLRTLRMLSLNLHHVQYKKANGEVVVGSFLAVLFASGDRTHDELSPLGLPLVNCNLQSAKLGKTLHVVGDWAGQTFLRLGIEGLNPFLDISQPSDIESHGSEGITPNGIKPVNGTATAPEAAESPSRGPPKIPKEEGMLWYKYSPTVGEPGITDAAYNVFAPFAALDRVKALEEGSGGFVEVFEGSWESLPTLHHVTKGLAQIPLYSIVQSKSEAIHGADNMSKARKLE
ncbi:FAD-dependent monooxygenase OpS4 [Paramyrothecium foliicola]|nr:FAD-dependent monooxygenase OpS4 [Paramyrothecium foliicola]